jgi:hypothetical protein
MCDYSLHTVKSRPARAGDELTTHDFHAGTRGFAASEGESVAVAEHRIEPDKIISIIVRPRRALAIGDYEEIYRIIYRT